MSIICKDHGVFTKRVSDHLKGSGCPECHLFSIRNTKDNFIRVSNIKHNNKYDYSLVKVFKSNKEKVILICPIHGNFKQLVNAHLNGQGCPRCKESKGENIISNILDNNKIDYYSQHKFDDCFYLDKLIFDFYLPKYNICLEYNGRQHYEPVEFFGGLDSFRKQLVRDDIKSKYCLDNNIKLITIKYDENIEERLRNELT